MNKEQFKQKYFQFLEAHHLSANQAVVMAGGACVMLGVRERTNDIDLEVSSSVFQILMQQASSLGARTGRSIYLKRANYIDYDRYSVHESKDVRAVHMVEGVAVHRADELLEFKKQLSRTKDQVDISALEYLLECVK